MFLKVLAVIVGLLIAGTLLVIGFLFDALNWVLYFAFGGIILGLYYLTTGAWKKK